MTGNDILQVIEEHFRCFSGRRHIGLRIRHLCFSGNWQSCKNRGASKHLVRHPLFLWKDLKPTKISFRFLSSWFQFPDVALTWSVRSVMESSFGLSSQNLSPLVPKLVSLNVMHMLLPCRDVHEQAWPSPCQVNTHQKTPPFSFWDIYTFAYHPHPTFVPKILDFVLPILKLVAFSWYKLQKIGKSN